jgi:hypothetical protein
MFTISLYFKVTLKSHQLPHEHRISIQRAYAQLVGTYIRGGGGKNMETTKGINDERRDSFVLK